MIQIEPVPGRKHKAALRFLAGGEVHDSIVDANVVLLRRYLARRGEDNVMLWWARQGRRCVATALVVRTPGRVGMLSYSPLVAPGVDAHAVGELAGELSRQGLAGGLSLVQAILLPGAWQDVEMLARVGFQKLAELLYMQKDLSSPLPEAASDGDVTWRRLGEYDLAELGKLIERTYDQSLDCPLLRGVRDVRDTIAGHQDTGQFRPQSWWIACCSGRPAACILLNETNEDAIEVVYLGVAPEFRRRGLAKAMLTRAAQEAWRCGRRRLSLAVDGRNLPARRLYEAEDFVLREQRVAYVMLRSESVKPM